MFFRTKTRKKSRKEVWLRQMKTFCAFSYFCFFQKKRKELKRLNWKESENSLTTEPSGRADTSITHGSFSCQMFNSKSVWWQLVFISFSCREVRTDWAALPVRPHPSTRLPLFQSWRSIFKLAAVAKICSGIWALALQIGRRLTQPTCWTH